MLLNYSGTLDSQFTLAHEMGHAIHSYLSTKTQPTVYSEYVIFVAEVASTCNEALLVEGIEVYAVRRLSELVDGLKGTYFSVEIGVVGYCAYKS